MEEVMLDMAESSLFGPGDALGSEEACVDATGSVPSENEEKSAVQNGDVMPQDDMIDMASSSLFGAPNTETATNTSDDDPGTTALGVSKEVKLFDGSTLVLKPKKKRVVSVDESLSNSDNLTMVDMDTLFRRAEQRAKFRENQRNAPKSDRDAVKVHKPTSVWTEKYRPRRFVDLCSGGNDKQYRLISHWLRKWSSVVFNEYTEGEEGVDALGRPFKKFLLITGPSGIGKTAAAHVIAKQMGYNVEELNAANSMDSGPGSSTGGNPNAGVFASLKLKIQNALTSNSIQKKGNKIISDGRPTCLVIDEIDTAGNSSDIIRVLNEINMADQKAVNQGQSGQKTDKNSKKAKLLNRPIICIANDAYTTSSRTWGGFNMDKLRSMSEIVTFQKPSFQKTNTGVKTGGKAITSVKEYIKWISEKERIKLDYQQVSELVEVCEGDIRACINYLQFNGRAIDRTMISDSEETVQSNKDSQISWFKLTDMLFKKDGQLTKEEDFDNLMKIILEGSGKSASSSSNTLDKVIRACFNRYLDSVYYQEDSLFKPCELSDWLEFYDKAGNIGIHQESVDYSSIVTLKFWSLFSEINPSKSAKPLVDDMKNLQFESDDANKANKAIIKTFMETIPIPLSLTLGKNEQFATSILPLVAKLISPELASAGTASLAQKSKSSLNEFDQKCLEKSALIVKDFGIHLETSRDLATNIVTLELSPNIDTLVTFKTTFSAVPYESLQKQLQVKRKWFFPLLQSELDRVEKFGVVGETKRKQAPEPAEAAKTKKQKVASSVDFFKGQYDGLSTQIQQAKDTVDTEGHRIWVKYNEGFSNAVRKHIGWSDLWKA